MFVPTGNVELVTGDEGEDAVDGNEAVGRVNGDDTDTYRFTGSVRGVRIGVTDPSVLVVRIDGRSVRTNTETPTATTTDTPTPTEAATATPLPSPTANPLADCHTHEHRDADDDRHPDTDAHGDANTDYLDARHAYCYPDTAVDHE